MIKEVDVDGDGRIDFYGKKRKFFFIHFFARISRYNFKKKKKEREKNEGFYENKSQKWKTSSL